MPDCYGRAELCRAFGVSRSGLYDHALKPRAPGAFKTRCWPSRSHAIFRQSRRTYGARRLQQVLRRQGIHCGRKRLGRLMSQLGLRPVQKRRSVPGPPRVSTTSRWLLIAFTSYLFLPVRPTRSGVRILPTCLLKKMAGSIWPLNWIFVPNVWWAGNSLLPWPLLWFKRLSNGPFNSGSSVHNSIIRIGESNMPPVPSANSWSPARSPQA